MYSIVYFKYLLLGMVKILIVKVRDCDCRLLKLCNR